MTDSSAHNTNNNDSSPEVTTPGLGSEKSNHNSGKNTLKRLRKGLKKAAKKCVKWARYNHDDTAPPRLLRYTLVALALVLVSITFGIITAQAKANFGPHDALYEITIDSAISVDAGPLGSVVLESPLPLALGVHATVGEIPESLTSVEATTTLESLGQDLNGYIQFFAAPQETISVVAQELIENAILRALSAAAVLIALGCVVAWIAGYSRRKELTYRAARATWGLTAGFVVVSVVAGVVLTGTAKREALAIGGRESVVFAGTALEGTKITGRLATVVDEYGGMLLDVYNENEEFYARANNKLAQAFDVRNPMEAHSEQLLQNSGKVPAESRDLVTILMVSDLHCNVGMAPLITTAAQKSGAKIIFNGGDTTINGTDIERFCMDAFSGAVPDGATMVQSDGNHDSDITSSQAANAGVVVLDGKIVEVEGIRILGDSDPRRTQIGQGSELVGAENYVDTGNRLSATACETQDRPDVLLIHTPAVGSAALTGGCIPYQFSGHMHTQDGPKLVGQGIQFVSGSSAGAIEGKPTIGPLNGSAEMAVLRFDRTCRTFVDWQKVTVLPDGTANVGPRITYPTIEQLLPAIMLAPTEQGGVGATEPASDPATDPASDPITDETPDPATDPASGSASDPISDETPEPATSPATSPSTDPKTVTDPENEPDTTSQN